ncbi:MAG TPA: 4-hydroxy-tetrahydrodipicolinate reductase [Myxococcales bacterium]|jgi:4-hydroxy-tetrahydrodipicolinate reductase|nr:4-hydroxy-tetrahydrodipicolinate reductase [Myxococcales bacterium]
MIRTVVTGVSGRMGSSIVRYVRDADDLELVGATERPGSGNIGLDVGLACRLGNFEVPIVDDLAKAIGKADVVIDFSIAEASVGHARICAEHKVPLVVGTTGLTAKAKADIVAASERVAILMAPNMSVGVNLMLRLVEQAARVLGGSCDIEIVEMHHRLKKDAPSGTALRLGEITAQATGRDPATDLKLSRVGQIGERPKGEIGIQALRGGDIAGEHTVYFASEGERLEITHRAFSRDQFALGALRAARFLVGKPPGLYDMGAVLGF